MMEYSFDLGAHRWPGTTKVIEEAAEVIQVLAKLMGRGNIQHWQGDLLPKIIEELGDLEAAIEFWKQYNLVPEEQARVQRRAESKLITFEEWHIETLDSRNAPLLILKKKQRPSQKPRSKK